MEEMNVEAINFGLKLAKAIEPRLAGSPIIMVPPMMDERFDLIALCALAPIVDQLCLGPTRAINPLAQILQLRLGNVEGKGVDCL
jgi:hypothetical protein